MILNMPLLQVAVLLPLLLMSLTFHEWAHGRAALALGDATAREQGRLTLNPLRHIDITGLIMLLVVGVGWARPVPIDIRRLRSPRRDLVLVSVAGPASNLLIAGVTGVIARLYLQAAGSPQAPLFRVLLLVTVINGMLFFFNMLPIPPLDGSKLLGMALQGSYPKLSSLYFRYGSYLLLAVLIAQVGFEVPIIPFSQVTQLILSLLVP